MRACTSQLGAAASVWAYLSLLKHRLLLSLRAQALIPHPPTAMHRFFPQLQDPSQTDDVILAPPTINPLAAGQPPFDEFVYRGRKYVRCSSLTKGPKHTRKRESKIWLWG